MSGGTEPEGQPVVQEFQLLQVALKIGFAFGLFAPADLLAKRAGMFAVKSFFQSLGEGGGVAVVRQHRSPGDGLHHRPMRPRRAEQREDQQHMAKTGEHTCFIIQAGKLVKRSAVQPINRLRSYQVI
jgi:hypothetical protein